MGGGIYTHNLRYSFPEMPHLLTCSREYSGLIVFSEGWSEQIVLHYMLTFFMLHRGFFKPSSHLPSRVLFLVIVNERSPEIA